MTNDVRIETELIKGDASQALRKKLAEIGFTTIHGTDECKEIQKKSGACRNCKDEAVCRLIAEVLLDMLAITMAGGVSEIRVEQVISVGVQVHGSDEAPVYHTLR